MKNLSKVALLVLLLGVIAAQEYEKDVTLRSIVSNVFYDDYDPDLTLLPSNLELAATTFKFNSSPLGLEKALISRGLSATLVKKLAALVKNPSVDEFKATGITNWAQSEFASVSAVCIYKGIAAKIEASFICVVGRAIHDAVMTPESAEQVRRAIYMEMKAEAFTLPLAYHVFTAKSLEEFSQLKSAKTQAELGRLMKAEAGTRDQVYIELNNNKNDPFLARLFKNGLTHYTSNAVIESIEGVDVPQLTAFSKYLADKLKLPEVMKRTLIDQLYLASISDKSEWKDIAFTYKLNIGEAKYMSVMTVTDEPSNTMDFLVCDIKAGFQMAPDILVTTVTKSKFFGLFKSTSIKIDRRPAELTDKSIDLLFKFFKVSAFDKFRKFRGF